MTVKKYKINRGGIMKVEETNNINSKLLELQQKLRNVELAIDLYEKDLYKIDKRLEKIENEGE